MKLRLPILSILIALFSFHLFAQNNPFPNEIENLRFSKDLRFSQLKLLSSTRDEVASIFGAGCVDSCKYNEDWNIDFSYVTKTEGYTDTKDGKPVIYLVQPHFVGKLMLAVFTPRRPVILPDSLVFPKGLTCRIYNDTGEPVKICWDENVISYRIYNEDDPKGKHKRNELFVLSYNISNENRKNLFKTEPEPVN